MVSAVGARAVLRLQVVDGGGREGGGEERGERGGGQLVQASVSARPAEAVLRLGVGWGGGGESLREVSSVPGASRQASLGVGEEYALILAEDERMSECYSVQTTTAKGEVEEEVRCTGLVLSEEGGWAVQASAFSEEGERGGEESAFSEEARRVKEARALSEEVRRVAEAEVVDAMVIAAAKLESGALPFEYDPKVRPSFRRPPRPVLPAVQRAKPINHRCHHPANHHHHAICHHPTYHNTCHRTTYHHPANQLPLRPAYPPSTHLRPPLPPTKLTPP